MISSTVVVCLVVLLGVTNSQLLGGRNPVDTNDAKVQEVATFAVTTLGSEYTLGEVLTAERQVVAGLKYFITASVTRTSPLGAVSNKSCEFEILEHWEKSQPSVLAFSCGTVVA